VAAYMEMHGLNRLLGEGDVITGASFTLDNARRRDFLRALKEVPRIGWVGVKESLRANFRQTTAASINLIQSIYLTFATVVAFGVVYNNARISLAERARELATLRVVGFSRREVGTVLITELVILAAVAVPLGYLFADFASGLAHWFCDTFFEEDTPVVGRLLIYPFRDHHRDPRAMTRHDVLELTGNSCLGMVPVHAGALTWAPGLFVEAWLLVFGLALFATNLFHRWAHAARAPRAVLWLQARGLVLAPGPHAVHHTPPNRAAYCVTSGWANRWTDRFGVFERLERALVALGVPATKAP